VARPANSESRLSAWAAAGTSARSFARCLLAGPNTPLYRTRWRRGGGMMPTSRRKNATGSMTRWVRPSGHGRLSLYAMRPSAVHARRSCANGLAHARADGLERGRRNADDEPRRPLP
jgi:hypothetical protein